jgi:copper(I)-binding protein
VSSSRWAATPIGRLVIAAAIVGLAGGVTACDAGNNAPTLEFHPQSDGVDTAVHGIKIIDAFVLSWADGTTPAGQNAGVYLAMYNDGSSADTLTSVTAPSVAKSVLLPAGGVSLPSKQAVYLTGPKPVIVLSGLQGPLAAGGTVHITFSFVNAGSVTLDLPVLQRSGAYATLSPAPAPTPTGTSKTPGASSSPSTTATPTGSATTTSSPTPSTTP